MLQAWLVLPAFFLAYLVAAPTASLLRRVGHTALATVPVVVVSPLQRIVRWRGQSSRKRHGVAKWVHGSHPARVLDLLKLEKLKFFIANASRAVERQYDLYVSQETLGLVLDSIL